MSELQNFKELVDEIEQLCKARQTGYIFITSEEKRLGRILLQSGHIISARYANKQSEQAILAMQSIKRGKINFHEGHFHENEDVSIATSTPVLLKTLRGLAELSKPSESVAKEKVELSSLEKEVLEDGLVEVLGPMASLIFDEIIENATDLNAAIEAASLEVNNDDDRQAFMAYIKKRLNY